MEKYITDVRTGLKYELVGDYYLLAGDDEPEDRSIGIKFSQIHRMLRSASMIHTETLGIRCRLTALPFLRIPALGNRGSGEMKTGVPAKRKPLPRRKRSESRAAASKSHSLKALSRPYTSRMDL